MRHIFLCFLIIFATLGISVTDASAGRFGGGRGFHSMRSSTVYNRAYKINTPGRAPIAKAPSKWRGALTGLLMGGLLASLFMGNGLGSMLMSWLMLGIVAILIMNFIQNRKQSKYRAERNID